MGRKKNNKTGVAQDIRDNNSEVSNDNRDNNSEVSNDIRDNNPEEANFIRDTVVLEPEYWLNDPGAAIVTSARKLAASTAEDIKEVHSKLSDIDGQFTEEASSDTEDDKQPDKLRQRSYMKLILTILAVISGTATGMFSAMALAISHIMDLTDVAAYKASQMIKYDNWAAYFVNDRSRPELLGIFVWLIVASVLIFAVCLIILCVINIHEYRGENLGGRGSGESTFPNGASAGSGSDGNSPLRWFDRWWTEVQLALGVTAACFAVVLTIPVANICRFVTWFSQYYKPAVNDQYVYDIGNVSVYILCGSGMAVLIFIALECLLSMVRKAAAGKLFEVSLLGKSFKSLFRGLRSGLKAVSRAVRNVAVPGDSALHARSKLALKYMLGSAALIVLPIMIGMGFNSPGVLILCIIIAVAVSWYIILSKTGKLAELMAGVIAVRNGELSHRIPVATDENGPKTDLDKIASDINHISEATDAAVQKEIKNQRMKTDLISNVSHDLKTPLTSMISYLDILEKEGLDSPDAPAHLAIVREKTDRLRTLTEELFEAAKASSGNIPCEISNIDLSALIEQALAEMDVRLADRELKIKKNIRTESTMIRADGKLMYRVLENLLSNISKYALEGSRVYIDVTDYPSENSFNMPQTAPGSMLLLEIKNISRDELNISAEELMERFTRGDQSRNTEGSGLGLAIARDLVSLMGGRFNISIDGDMFKASILLSRAA